MCCKSIIKKIRLKRWLCPTEVKVFTHIACISNEESLLQLYFKPPFTMIILFILLIILQFWFWVLQRVGKGITVKQTAQKKNKNNSNLALIQKLEIIWIFIRRFVVFLTLTKRLLQYLLIYDLLFLKIKWVDFLKTFIVWYCHSEN